MMLELYFCWTQIEHCQIPRMADYTQECHLFISTKRPHLTPL